MNIEEAMGIMHPQLITSIENELTLFAGALQSRAKAQNIEVEFGAPELHRHGVYVQLNVDGLPDTYTLHHEYENGRSVLGVKDYPYYLDLCDASIESLLAEVRLR